MNSDVNLKDDDIANITPTIMQCLCQEYRRRKNNDLPTDIDIEYFRQEFIPDVKSSQAFRNAIERIATIGEIELDGENIMLTEIGISQCKKYDSTFQ